MLVELVVENYAVVERLRVRFQAGLNLLTGETGSGKSLVVDALGLLFGGRASADVVRTGAERARVSGIFEAPSRREFRVLLDQAGIELEDDELLIEREVFANGKSRAFVSSRPATATLLRDLAPYLGDIHGQHDQQRLFTPEAQRELLDAFAGAEESTAETTRLYHEWRAASGELAELARREQEQLRLADLWSFQRKEIESAAVKPGEDAALEQERRILQNVTRLAEYGQAAYAALYDAPESALAQLRTALRRLQEIGRIDQGVRELSESLQPSAIAMEEASRSLRDYLDKLEADPARLERIESRLALLDRLKRKYGSTLEEIAAFGEKVREQLEAVETAGERRAEIERRQARLAEEYAGAASKLSALRRAAAGKLAPAVERELAALGMENTAFRVDVREGAWSETGADEVAFLVSPNVGEEPRPLDKVASGGELSRLALALKTAAGRRRPSARAQLTLVFDEVDAGIGGAAAESVGRRLKQLAASSQVLCVTHLAQVAGFADHHYRVDKRESGGRATVTVDELNGPERTREIGRMLSGQKLTPEALRHAEKLIRLSTT